MKAIETRYAGCRFRSRLEARWAVFFDALGITWEYEPQGFMIESSLYLPDFYLPPIKLWVEIKPAQSAPAGLEKFWAFAEKIEFIAGTRAALFEGDIPRAHDDPSLNIQVLGDESYRWCACSTGQHFDVQYLGRNERIPCGCPGFEPGGRWLIAPLGGYEHLIDDAYTAARSARFEHGEAPA